MARTDVVFEKDFTFIIPASTIQVRDFDGNLIEEIPTPEYKHEYKAGDKYWFKSKKDAKAFITANGGESVCRIVEYNKK